MKPGRDSGEQRIIAQLAGMGSPDLTVAALAYERITGAGAKTLAVDMLG